MKKQIMTFILTVVMAWGSAVQYRQQKLVML